MSALEAVDRLTGTIGISPMIARSEAALHADVTAWRVQAPNPLTHLSPF